MRLAAEDYRDAAAEHVATARLLHDAGRYAAAHYLAGLAVECILRAYRRRMDPAFDARHDLEQLMLASGFGQAVSRLKQPEQRDVETAFAEVVVRWRNNLRYGSEGLLRRFLKAQLLDRGIRGNYLKENSRRICDGAEVIVEAGLRLWSR
jgi:hypothetical protein